MHLYLVQYQYDYDELEVFLRIAESEEAIKKEMMEMFMKEDKMDKEEALEMLENAGVFSIEKQDEVIDGYKIQLIKE